MEKRSVWYGGLTAVTLALFILAASIAVPLVCRPFYYAHIDALNLTETTPWSESEIRQAFDEMMDFCLGGGEFSTGVLKWSEEGKQHFEDCAVLFRLDFYVLGVSAALLVLCLILYRKGKRPALLLHHGPFFWAGTGLAAGFLILAGLAAADFDRAFVIFHHLFFPGKSNWLFDPAKDEIIRILPEVFFRNCAILIVAVLFLLCLLSILLDFSLRRKEKKAAG